MAELDVDGNIIWEKLYSFYDSASAPYYSKSEWFNSVVISDDGFILTGTSIDSSDNNPLGWMVKTDFAGNELWNRRFRKRNNDNYLQDIIELPGGDLMAVGYVFGEGSASQDGWILRTNCLGFDDYPSAQVNWYNAAENTVILENLSERYGTGTVNWGDGSSATFTENDDSFISHTYPTTATYEIEFSVNACFHADTINFFVDATPLGITENEVVNEFVMYPNPATNQVTVQFNNLDVAAQNEIYITDLNGKIVHREILESNTTLLDVSYFESGIYLVNWYSENGIVVKKMVVN